MLITNANNSQNPTDSTDSITSWLGPARDMVNEEELFHALICCRFSDKFGAETAQRFHVAVQTLQEKAAANKQRLGIEDASVAALDSLVAEKKLERSDRDIIVAQCFDAAQLDGNKDSLWDSVGGKGDPTVATAAYDAALSTAQSALKEIDAGRRKYVMAPYRSASGGASIGSYLFKPSANSSGTAAFLFPASVGKAAASVTIEDSGGKIIDTGRFTSFGDNGDMAKYVFHHAGRDLPKGSVVIVRLRDGNEYRIRISDPSKRSTATTS